MQNLLITFYEPDSDALSMLRVFAIVARQVQERHP